MDNRGNLIGGILLIAVGIVFLLVQFMPDLLGDWFSWPLIIIGAGALFLVWALLSGEGGLAVPGSIIGGIGLLLFWQNATDNWESWSYAWALIPGFVGVGLMLGGLIDEKMRKEIRSGAIMVVISAVLFAIFGSFLGLDADIARYWPLILIAFGLFALFQAVFRSGRG